jgi:flagellar basal body rod protein FlgG
MIVTSGTLAKISKLWFPGRKFAQAGKGGIMLRGLYSATTALLAADDNHEVVAQNLAHADVPGYRRQGASFTTFAQALAQVDPNRTLSEEDLYGTAASRFYTNFDTGPMQVTGNPLDVAANGDSFFVIQGPDGPLYTRNGSFTLNNQGQLLTKDGRTVSGTAGPITIPPNASNIVVATDGTVSADGVPLGQLRLARFPDPTVLERVGTTLFRAPPGVQPQAGTGTVLQGYREGSNVQVVTEMVSMIAGMRHFQASQRALRALSESLQLSTRPQGA